MNRTRALAVPATIFAALLHAAPALATGVAAGTLIANTATASYDEAGTTVTVQSNTVTVRVDEVLDVAVAGLASGTTALSSTPSAVPFRVTNTGNGDESFSLALATAIAGNGFDAVSQGIALDSNGNGVYDAGVDQVLGAGAATPPLAPDAALTAFALVALPAGVADGASSEVRLAATAATGSGAPGTAFSGAGLGGGDAVVGASTANAGALAALVASAATVTLTKSATIADPFGSSRAVPGAVVTYTLLAQASGSGSAANVRVADAIPAGTTYRAGSLTLGASALSDAADGDAGQGSAAGIDVSVGTLSGGASRTVTFQVTVN